MKITTTELAASIFKLREQRRALEAEELALRRALLARIIHDQNERVTTYNVRATRVKAYNRRSYRAVRVRRA
jgi:hypothetical protein